jgi:hypothetical protein
MEALLVQAGTKYRVPFDFALFEETFPSQVRMEIGAVIQAQYVCL